jgi:addiction module HigA family antidote
MPVIAAKRVASRPPTHPGFLLADTVIPATGKSKTEIARLLGISRQQLHAILDERAPISPAVAVKLGKLFGNGADLWIRMQAAYDIWQASRTIDTSGIPTLQAVET